MNETVDALLRIPWNIEFLNQNFCDIASSAGLFPAGRHRPNAIQLLSTAIHCNFHNEKSIDTVSTLIQYFLQ